MLAAAAATLALMGAADDPGYAFARSLALAGPRPAGGRGELRAHRRVAAAFRAAGLDVPHDRFGVPGHGRSRNVVGVLRRPGACLWIVMAHADTVPPSPGADDNGSGVGTVVALAPRVAALAAAARLRAPRHRRCTRDGTARPVGRRRRPRQLGPSRVRPRRPDRRE